MRLDSIAYRYYLYTPRIKYFSGPGFKKPVARSYIRDPGNAGCQPRRNLRNSRMGMYYINFLIFYYPAQIKSGN